MGYVAFVFRVGMKAVLISIHPKWCEKIFNGSKSIEVRKSRPSLDMPFKVYVYMTKPKPYLSTIIRDGDNIYGDIYHGKTLFIKSDRHYYNRDYQTMEQRVIVSFVCDRVFELKINGDDYGNYWHEWDDEGDIQDMCLSYEELETYLGKSVGYGWHISDLKIYDKPKELGEFLTPSGTGGVWGNHYLSRPPQSWCYVEELE